MTSNTNVRLNKEIRSKISYNVLKYRFANDLDAFCQKMAAFADKVYTDVYPVNVQKQMNDLPRGWLPMADNIRVTFGSERFVQLEFNGALSFSRYYGFSDDTGIGRLQNEFSYRKEDVKRVVQMSKTGCAKVYETSSDLAIEYNALMRELKDLETQMKESAGQILKVLGSVASVNRLKEVWPEVAPFVTEYESYTSKLPSVPVEQLNKALKLPMEKAA